MTDSTRTKIKTYKPANIQRFTGDCDNCDMSSVVDKLQPWGKMTSARDANRTPEERGIANKGMSTKSFTSLNYKLSFYLDIICVW